MNVTVSALRAELSTWLDRARAGEEVLVTERGTPVARLVPVHAAPLIDRLVRQGVVGKAPAGDRRPTARSARRVHATGPVAELVRDQRR